MAFREFTSVPTVDELMAVSNQIDRDIASQIIQLSSQWAKGSEKHMLHYINEMAFQLSQRGRESWSEIRWSGLMGQINQLSQQINDSVDHIRGKSRFSDARR
jgi:hypothetical protein